MKEGFSTATDNIREMGFGAGMGLPNMVRSADEFTIKSSKRREHGFGCWFVIESRCSRGEILPFSPVARGAMYRLCQLRPSLSYGSDSRQGRQGPYYGIALH